jgi:hypothetical protein
MGSELRSSGFEGKIWLRLWEAVGGVFDSGGDISVGVAISSSTCAFVATVFPKSPGGAEKNAPGCALLLLRVWTMVPKKVMSSWRGVGDDRWQVAVLS